MKENSATPSGSKSKPKRTPSDSKSNPKGTPQTQHGKPQGEPRGEPQGEPQGEPENTNRTLFASTPVSQDLPPAQDPPAQDPHAQDPPAQDPPKPWYQRTGDRVYNGSYTLLKFQCYLFISMFAVWIAGALVHLYQAPVVHGNVMAAIGEMSHECGHHVRFIGYGRGYPPPNFPTCWAWDSPSVPKLTLSDTVDKMSVVVAHHRYLNCLLFETHVALEKCFVPTGFIAGCGGEAVCIMLWNSALMKAPIGTATHAALKNDFKLCMKNANSTMNY